MTLNPTDITALVRRALEEDIGAGDITTQALIPEALHASARFAAREPLVMCGASVVEEVFAQLADECHVHALLEDGERAGAGEPLLHVQGRAQLLLSGERVALNLLQRMCGIATLTARYVEAVQGTRAVILDTRKTMPGLRMLDKYAVLCGGGQNHRMGLFDAVMIKDNHIALSGGVREAVEKVVASGMWHVARDDRHPEGRCPEGPWEGGSGGPSGAQLPQDDGFSPPALIIECDTLEQVKAAVEVEVDRILLDNMTPEELREAVTLVAGRVLLEASGNVTLETVRSIANTGVEYISVGRLTHSAPAADIGLDITLNS